MLPDGSLGENLTTCGVDPNQALIGEQWRIGDDSVLQVTGPRLPCQTFAARMGVRGWAKRFTADGRPGAYLRVVHPGSVRAGDKVGVRHRPDHEVTVSMALFAFTTKPGLLAGLFPGGRLLVREMRGYIHSKLK